MSMLGCLLCFPNHLVEIPVLQPSNTEMSSMKCTEVKAGIFRAFDSLTLL